MINGAFRKIKGAFSKKWVSIALVSIFFISFGIFSNYHNLKPIKKNGKVGQEKIARCLADSQTIVTKVIDGDTVIVEGGHHIRLLGIDSDEKGYPCYEPAKLYLEKLILGKKVKLEKDGADVDKYGRCLRYIFVGQKNVDLEMVKKGLAVARFYGSGGVYEDKIEEAEKKAIDNKVGCKWSGRSQIKITENNQNAIKEKEGKFAWQRLLKEKTGLNVIPSCQAGNYLGKKVIIEGKIASSYLSPKSGTLFLNFNKPYPKQCLTAVIFKSDLPKFGENPKSYYSRKTVRVIGLIKEYKDKLEIILNYPSQIEISQR